jgi:transposase
VQEEVQAAEAVLVARAHADPIAGVLDGMVGIGPVLALTLRAEIGDITRFPRGPQLASYAGIVARVGLSAGRGHYGRITREGSPWLRWALVEAAVHAMRREDGLGRWARQLTRQKGIAKARVALARRLCDEIVHRWPRSV